MTLTWVALVLALGTVALVVARTFPEWRTWRKEDFLVLAASAPLAALFWVAVVRNPVQGLDREFNAGRLAPVCGLLRGYSLYYPPEQGPVMNLIYPPLAALVYLPAALCPSPGSAIFAASILVQAYLIVPLFLCFWRTRASGLRGGLFALLSVFAVTVFLNRNYATAYWFQNIHADAPSLGFGLLACMMLTGKGTSLERRAILAAAFFASCSVYAKQTSIGVAFGLAAYLLLCHGWRRSLEFGLAFGVLSLLIGLIFVAAFGWTPLVFNVFTVPSRHPLYAWDVVMNLPAWTLPGFVSLSIGVLLSCIREHQETPAEARPPLKARPWLPFLVVAVAMVPTSLMGRLKVGGFANSFHFLMYLDVAAALALSLQGWGNEGGRFRPWFASFAVSAFVLGGSITMVDGPSVMDPYFENFGREELLFDNQFVEADQLLQDHGGEVHFLYNPLTPLYRTGRLTHFEYGLYDRTLAGFQPSDAHIREYLPRKISLLARTLDLPEDLGLYQRLAPPGTRFRGWKSGRWQFYAYQP
jgi:hypothetical protein